MDYHFRFQLLASDIVKIQPIALGKYYRALVIFSCGTMLAFSLSYLVRGENLALGAFMAVTASVMLFDRWLLYPPYLALRDNDASVKIDGQNLTSSLGEKSYDIPWRYFLEHGSLLENNDHFYFKSKLGNIYLPKRAFTGDDDMNRFRNNLSGALGIRCSTSHFCLRDVRRGPVNVAVIRLKTWRFNIDSARNPHCPRLCTVLLAPCSRASPPH